MNNNKNIDFINNDFFKNNKYNIDKVILKEDKINNYKMLPLITIKQLNNI